MGVDRLQLRRGVVYRARYAILLDGGFLTKKLYQILGRHATAEDLERECDRLRNLPEVSDYELLRIYYYDAPPSAEKVKMPVSTGNLSLSTTDRYRLSQSLYDQLILKPDFALRMGRTNLAPDQWRLKPRVLRELIRKAPRPLFDDDFQLDLS